MCLGHIVCQYIILTEYDSRHHYPLRPASTSRHRGSRSTRSTRPVLVSGVLALLGSGFYTFTLPGRAATTDQRPPSAATALAGPRSATRQWRQRSGSAGAPSIVRLSIHPPPPPTPYSEYNLWPHPYRPDWLWPPGPVQHSPTGRGFAVTRSLLFL